jgi:hypothetical protein
MAFFDDFKPTRRSLLAAGGAGLVAGMLPRSILAQTLTPITTAFGWIPNVEYAGFWTALEQGFFADAGIDAGYISGGPQAPTRWCRWQQTIPRSAPPTGFPFLMPLRRATTLSFSAPAGSAARPPCCRLRQSR